MSVDDDLIGEACAAFGVNLVRDLKSGGQKTVRLVEREGRELVLKVIEVGVSSPVALRRAQREVELLQGISNLHVVSVESDLLEVGQPVRGAAWLEEYLEGDDLTALVGQPWDWADALDLASDVADGLAALHEASVVHRDLSSNNVRRVTAGSYRVLDPGFARHTLRSGLTIGGQPGTPGFLSPEHLRSYSGAPTASSDVYGVGTLLYLALTGDLPIPYRGDDADYVDRLSRVEIKSLATLRPDLTDGQVALVNRCLHPQPARRYRNGGRLAEALEDLK